MNAKGAGLAYVSEYKSDELRTFRGGLRHVAERAEYMAHNSKNNLSNYHDKFNYERVRTLFIVGFHLTFKIIVKSTSQLPFHVWRTKGILIQETLYGSLV